MTISRFTACALVMSVLFLTPLMCSRAQGPALTPSAQVQQPDGVLFQRAMKAMKESKFVAARTLLNNLIRNYPDSDYVPRAKLAIGDAWYREGAFAKAAMEYTDFITFFPNRPEVAEAKLKLDSIQKR
jgi:outer membrane protein assembly factor BamD